MAWVHHPISTSVMIALAGALAFCNAIARFLNYQIRTPNAQRRLSIAMLTIDALVAWDVIFLFVHEFYTAAYAGFALIIMEAAMRFGLAGSLVMGLVFALGLYRAMIFQELEFGVRFSASGYAFWTIIMMLIALGEGLSVRESQRQRQKNERLIEERTLLLERQRLSRELHDGVLKTLQGLALEARLLQSKMFAASPVVEQKARYIEEVCHRSNREIRELVFELHNDKQKSIISQMSEILENWSKGTGIPAELALSGEDQTLPVRISYNLCSVLTEALANIKQHASASHVHVSIESLPNEINVEVSDDGCGLGSGIKDLSSFTSMGKLGIAGMKERVEQIGGRFWLQSDRTGTKLFAAIPLPTRSAHQ